MFWILEKIEKSFWIFLNFLKVFMIWNLIFSVQFFSMGSLPKSQLEKVKNHPTCVA